MKAKVIATMVKSRRMAIMGNIRQALKLPKTSMMRMDITRAQMTAKETRDQSESGGRSSKKTRPMVCLLVKSMMPLVLSSWKVVDMTWQPSPGYYLRKKSKSKPVV